MMTSFPHRITLTSTQEIITLR
ncbi:unnamed protein product, partial [Rotaria sp. Silwood1]